MPLADQILPQGKAVFATVTLRIKPEAKDHLNRLAEKFNVSQGEILEAFLRDEKKRAK